MFFGRCGRDWRWIHWGIFALWAAGQLISVVTILSLGEGGVARKGYVACDASSSFITINLGIRNRISLYLTSNISLNTRNWDVYRLNCNSWGSSCSALLIFERSHSAS
jgi:hypothetical protein